MVFVDNFESEGGDLCNIDLPAGQNQLVTDVAAANPNTVVVVNSGSRGDDAVGQRGQGRDRSLVPGAGRRQRDRRRCCSATSNPSRQAAGDVPDRAGRTCPRTRPRNGPARTAPCSTPRASRSATAGTHQKDITPLFPFGFGLSYTTFAYAHLTVAPAQPRRGTRGVAPTSPTPGRGPAPTWPSCTSASRPRPASRRQLKGFQRVTLRPGQTGRVELHRSTAARLRLVERGHGWTVTPGTTRLMVGDSVGQPAADRARGGEQ